MSGVVFWAAGNYLEKNVRFIIMICGQIVARISVLFLYTLPLDSMKLKLAALYVEYFDIGAHSSSPGSNAANTMEIYSHCRYHPV